MKQPHLATILSIETSCDETAAAVLRGDLGSDLPSFLLLSNVVRSQIDMHAQYGGVVPELAARAHTEAILPVVTKALADAKLTLEDISHIAVTSGPGLIGSLLVGVEFAKGLSFASGIPLVPTNHMEGHLFSAFGRKESDESRVTSNEAMTYPVMALVVSGGHTMLVLQESEEKYKVVGSTVDDAAGEAFDKVARLLGLPYPGGPEVSKLAAEQRSQYPVVRSQEISFPRPMLNSPNFDFSFSGLKTAVRYYIEELEVPSLEPRVKAGIARAFEDAVIDVLVQKTVRAAKKFACKTITLSGGVSANILLRSTLRTEAEKNRFDFVMPPFELSTDNAGMIGIAAYYNLRNGQLPVNPEEVKANPSWEIW